MLRSRRARVAALLVVGVCLGGRALASTDEVELTGITFLGSDGSRQELVLEAEHVRMKPGSDRAQLEQVHVHMAADDGVRALDMRCERGQLDLATNSFRAEGNVVGTTGDGRRFFTPWLTYDSHTGIVSTEARVRILDGARTLQGKGFRYHVRDARFVLTGGASVVQDG